MANFVVACSAGYKAVTPQRLLLMLIGCEYKGSKLSAICGVVHRLVLLLKAFRRKHKFLHAFQVVRWQVQTPLLPVNLG